MEKTGIDFEKREKSARVIGAFVFIVIFVIVLALSGFPFPF